MGGLIEAVAFYRSREHQAEVHAQFEERAAGQGHKITARITDLQVLLGAGKSVKVVLCSDYPFVGLDEHQRMTLRHRGIRLVSKYGDVPWEVPEDIRAELWRVYYQHDRDCYIGPSRFDVGQLRSCIRQNLGRGADGDQQAARWFRLLPEEEQDRLLVEVVPEELGR